MFLISLRIAENLTQQELADKVSITRQMVSAIENGAMPSVDTAKKIATELGFNWTKFFENETEKSATSAAS